MLLDSRKVNVNCASRTYYLTGDGVTCSLRVKLTTKLMSQVHRAMFKCNGMCQAPGLAVLRAP